jgi:hypothetical protein
MMIAFVSISVSIVGISLIIENPISAKNGSLENRRKPNSDK